MPRQAPSTLPLVAIIVLTALLAGTLSRSAQLDITTGLVQMCIVVGLYSFIGVTGVFSFGHIGFAAVGAYVAGIVAVPVAQKELLYTELPGWLSNVEVDPFLAVLVGALGAGVVAVVLAPSLGRVSGLSAALATFAMLVIVYVIARNYEPLTRGTKGMLGVPRETTLWVAAAWAMVAVVVVDLFQHSRVGLQLRAAREDDIAARAMGTRVGLLRGIALVLSGVIVGAAGAVYGQLLGSFNPDVFYLDLTFLTLAMLVVGGINSLTGAVVGTLLLTFLAQWLRDLEATLDRPGLTEVCFAVLMFAILVLRPSGVTGGRELRLPRWSRRSRGEVAGPEAGQDVSAAPARPNSRT